MPTYTVTSANLTLTTDQEVEIAAAITRSHHENTDAPAYFAQVIFESIEDGKHYIGGKAYRTPHLFVHGRAGGYLGLYPRHSRNPDGGVRPRPARTWRRGIVACGDDRAETSGA